MLAATAWLHTDTQVGLVFLCIGGVVFVMLATLVWAMSRWGE